jgi:heavy metal response regulator
MRTLLVEDEKKIAEFIRRGLKEEGYAVDVAGDGQEGHFLATTQTYDVIILDWMLPQMDGVTLCRQLRQEKITTPVLMLTAKDTVADRVKGLDAGASDYLVKPFAFEELLARLRALLRRFEGQEQTVLKAADLSMDLVTHTVTRQGRKVTLTAKEFALLEYFLRHKGEVVTRTMLSEHVWDMHFDSFTNVIDVYVNYLRKKIGKDPSKPLIQTVRGRGYILKA